MTTQKKPAEAPDALYARLFELPEADLEPAYRAHTDLDEGLVERIMAQREAGRMGLVAIRMRLAREGVTRAHGAAAAHAAEVAYLEARAKERGV